MILDPIIKSSEETGIIGFPWKNVWKKRVPHRIGFFGWIAASGIILTGDNLLEKGMIIVNWCCMC